MPVGKSEVIEVPTNSVPTVAELGLLKSSFRSCTQLEWMSPVITTGLEGCAGLENSRADYVQLRSRPTDPH